MARRRPTPTTTHDDARYAEMNAAHLDLMDRMREAGLVKPGAAHYVCTHAPLPLSAEARQRDAERAASRQASTGPLQ